MAGYSLKCSSHTIRTWQQFMALYLKRLNGRSFIFRGQAIEPESYWSFQTELERAWLGMVNISSPRTKNNERKAFRRKLEGQSILKIEEGLLREFKRKCSLYLGQAKPVHRLEWLALMRHFGAPTRLLDWTYSIYVAAFLSLNKSGPKRPATIWALDVGWLEQRMRKITVSADFDGNLWDVLFEDVHLKEVNTWNEYFSDECSFVLPVNPFTLNKRLVIQQGLFLCPGNITIPFQDNLARLQKDDPESSRALVRIRLDLNNSAKKNFLRQLYRMNITMASLFPGLEGFAQSLSAMLLFPKTLAAKSSLDSQ